tara:strand:- start:312 stop:542 length:231 start_codon:yes stop_codon:yes gene_type:complete
MDIKYDIWLGMIKQLDLHGIKHEEVDRLVENFVLLNETPMRIITGNSDTMRGLVIEVLDKHNIKYERFVPSHITIL